MKKTAPVYYALGNHEIAYRQRKDKNLYQKLQKAGAKVVEKEYEDIKVRGNKIRIGGLYEYAFAVDGAGNMIITRGLGSDKEKLPRFHNIPEIVVIRLEKR